MDGRQSLEYAVRVSAAATDGCVEGLAPLNPSLQPLAGRGFLGLRGTSPCLLQPLQLPVSPVFYLVQGVPGWKLRELASSGGYNRGSTTGPWEGLTPPADTML